VAAGAHCRTSSSSFPSPFWLLRLSRLFERVVPRLFYLRVINIYSVIIWLLFLYAREGRTGIFINDIYRWGWFLGGTHSCKEDSWEARTVTCPRQLGLGVNVLILSPHDAARWRWDDDAARGLCSLRIRNSNDPVKD